MKPNELVGTIEAKTERTSGIYMIYCTISEKCYIGQSRNIRVRFNTHKSSLNNGTHGNNHLQRSWNKYNHDSFLFIVLENCENLNEREDYWASLVDKEYLMNQKTTGQLVSLPAPKRVMTDKWKEALSKRNKTYKWTEEARKKVSEARLRDRRSKLTEQQVLEIRKRLDNGEMQLSLAKEYGVGHTCIYNIKYNKKWKSLKETI